MFTRRVCGTRPQVNLGDSALPPNDLARRHPRRREQPPNRRRVVAATSSFFHESSGQPRLSARWPGADRYGHGLSTMVRKHPRTKVSPCDHSRTRGVCERPSIDSDRSHIRARTVVAFLKRRRPPRFPLAAFSDVERNVLKLPPNPNPRSLHAHAATDSPREHRDCRAGRRETLGTKRRLACWGQVTRLV